MKQLISWFEIPSIDFDRAVSFYKIVLQIDIHTFDYGQDKIGCLPCDGKCISGAICYSPTIKPASEGVLIFLNGGNDINDFLHRVEVAKGKIVTPKTKIDAEGMGYFAIFIDSEGNKLGVHSEN